MAVAPPVPAAPRPASRRRLWLAAGVVLVAAAGGAVWYFTRPGPGPAVAPPEVKADGVDPEVVKVIHEARQKVLDDPRSAEAWGDLVAGGGQR